MNRDSNGDPYLFNPGDMGSYQLRPTGAYGAASGEPIMGRFLIAGTQKFTGGENADGSPTLAKDHPPILPDDIPAHIPWPRLAGPDPR